MGGGILRIEREPWVREIMKGGYDLHVHTLPSHFARGLDDMELARQCDDFGMAGALIKSHYEPTAGRAVLVNRYSGAKAVMYGAVALNQPVGGINPYAAECALRLGGVLVWLPTRDAENDLHRGSKPNDFLQRPPVKFLGEDGRPVQAFYEVLEVVRRYGAWLATGHLSAAEARTACLEGVAMGVNMILTHPDMKRIAMPLDEQCALARAGVLVEKAWGNVCNGYLSADDMAASIREIGAGQVFMVTDFGQKDHPSPMGGMRDFTAAMLEKGVSPEELKTMICTNPSRIVGA